MTQFTALKTDKVAFDGINIYQFAEGEEYDFPEHQMTRLRELGIAPGGALPAAAPVALETPAAPALETKPADPVTETKPAHPAKAKKGK